MPPYLGNLTEDQTIHFMWSSYGADGASITRATNGTVSVYKANGTTQSTAGVTDTEDFDSLTGIHLCIIDTSADAFYAVANDYAVVLSAATIDGKTVNAVLALFSIENRFIEADVTKWNGTAVHTPGTAGIPEVAIHDQATVLVDAILDEVVEGTLTLRQIQRIVLAVLAGKSGGGGTTTDTFRDVADTKNRVSATVSSVGNRTAITLDGS